MVQTSDKQLRVDSERKRERERESQMTDGTLVNVGQFIRLCPLQTLQSVRVQ